jgi:hypothetical protein
MADIPSSSSLTLRPKRNRDSEVSTSSAPATLTKQSSPMGGSAESGDEVEGSAKRQRVEPAPATAISTPVRAKRTSMGPPSSPYSSPSGSKPGAKRSPSSSSSPGSRGQQRPSVNPYPNLDEESFPKRDTRVEKPSSPSSPNRIILPIVSPSKKLFTKSPPVASGTPTRSEAPSSSAPTRNGASGVSGATGAAGQERKEQGGGTVSYDPFVEK